MHNNETKQEYVKFTQKSKRPRAKMSAKSARDGGETITRVLHAGSPLPPLPSPHSPRKPIYTNGVTYPRIPLQ